MQITSYSWLNCPNRLYHILNSNVCIQNKLIFQCINWGWTTRLEVLLWINIYETHPFSSKLIACVRYEFYIWRTVEKGAKRRNPHNSRMSSSRVCLLRWVGSFVYRKALCKCVATARINHSAPYEPVRLYPLLPLGSVISIKAVVNRRGPLPRCHK